jgi:site-specific DNA recombinase
MIMTFASTARKRLRLENSRYRRDHSTPLAQRAEIANQEVRIMGSKSELLRKLVAAPSVIGSVHSSVQKSRAIQNKTVNSYIIEMAI